MRIAKTIEQITNEHFYPVTVVKTRDGKVTQEVDYSLEVGKLIFVTGYDLNENYYTAINGSDRVYLVDSRSWAVVEDSPEFDWSLDFSEWLQLILVAGILSLSWVRFISDTCHQAKHPSVEVSDV